MDVIITITDVARYDYIKVASAIDELKAKLPKKNHKNQKVDFKVTYEI